MCRYSKFVRLIACGLAAALLAGCTSPSQVVTTTLATAKPLVTTASITTGTSAATTAATTKAPDTTATTAAPSAVPGYGDQEMYGGETYPYAAGNPVTKANFPNYYTSVGLGYHYYEYALAHDGSYEISIGLPFDESVVTGENQEPYLVKDADVSGKLVGRIITQAEAFAVSGIPKMRGQQKYAEMEIESINVYAYLQSLQNNVASYLIYRTLRLTDAEDGSHWISDVYPMTFDLNTGDLVPLKALFVDGYDYKARINDVIEAYLMENGALDESEYGIDYRLRLLAPFAGIRDDQPYYVAGESLYIVLDFGNPEIHMFESTYAIDIPLYELADCLALYDRYATDEPLTAEGFRYQLTSIAGLENGTGATVDFGDSKKYLYRTISYMANGLTDAATSAFMKWISYNQLPIQSYKVMADADLKYEGGDIRAYDQSVSASIYGGYAVMNFNAFTWGFVQEGVNYSANGVYSWNLEEDRPATITDYFVEGYDYAAMLEAHIRDSSYLSPLLDCVESFDELIDPAVPSLDKPMQPDTIVLCPQRYGFEFTIRMSGEEKWGELYEEHGGSFAGNIMYEDIGYENLTLFQN